MNSRLIVSESGRDRVHELFGEAVVVGRAPDAGLHLRDADAAPTHCEIRPVGPGYKVIDLETTSGTMVNGRLVNQHLLHHGDTIQIGAARITYLGASAPEPRGVRGVQPLTDLPVDDRGRTRRFYRHESTGRELPGALRIGIVAVSLAAIALGVWSLSRTAFGEDEAPQAFAAAEALVVRGDDAALERAIQLLLPLEGRQFGGRSADDLLAQARSDLRTRRLERERREEAALWSTISVDLAEHAGDAGWLRARLQEYVSRYPEGAHLAELRKRVEEAEAQPPPDPDAWSALATAIQAAIDARGFGDALKRLSDAEGNPRLGPGARERIERLRAEVGRAFKAHFDEQCLAAVDAKARGDSEQARKILAALAEAGVEPYSSEARRLLEKTR